MASEHHTDLWPPVDDPGYQLVELLWSDPDIALEIRDGNLFAGPAHKLTREMRLRMAADGDAAVRYLLELDRRCTHDTQVSTTPEGENDA